MADAAGPVWALKCLLRGGANVAAIACRLSPGSDDVVLVQEKYIRHLRLNRFCNLAFVADYDLHDSVLDACLVRSDCIAMLLASGCLCLFTDGKFSTAAIPQPSPALRASRLMRSSPDGSRIAAASFDDLLWIISMATLVSESIPVCGVITAMTWVNDNSLIVVTSRATTSDPSNNNCHICVVRFTGQVSTNPSAVDIPSIEGIPFHGEATACLVWRGRPESVVVCDQEKAMLIDVSSQHSKVISVSNNILWNPKGHEHRVHGTSPIITASAIVAEHILVLTEAGDLYTIIWRHERIQLLQLGLACPSRNICGFEVSSSFLLSDSVDHVAMDQRNTPAAIVVLPGDLCHGQVNIISDFETFERISKVQTLPCFSPIGDAAIMEHRRLSVGCSLGKHGSLQVLQHGRSLHSCSISIKSFAGVTSIFSLPCLTSSFPILAVAYVDSIRCFTAVASDTGQVRLSCNIWTFLQGVTTSSIAYIGKDKLCQVHSRGVRILFSDHLEGNEVVVDWNNPDASPISCSECTADGVVVFSAENTLYLLSVDQNVQVIAQKGGFPADISSLAIVEAGFDNAYHIPNQNRVMIIVGCNDGSILVIDADVERGTIKLLKTLVQGTGAMEAAQSIVVLELETMFHIIVGRRDGNVVRYSCEMASPDLLFRGPQLIRVGISPVTLVMLQEFSNHDTILAMSDHAVLIFPRGDSVQVVPVSKILGSSPDKDHSSKFSAIRTAAAFGYGTIATVVGGELIFFQFDVAESNSDVLSCNSSDSALRVCLNHTPHRVCYHEPTKTLIASCSDVLEGVMRSALYLINPVHGEQWSFGTVAESESIHSLYVWSSAIHGLIICVGSSFGDPCPSSQPPAKTEGQLRLYSIALPPHPSTADHVRVQSRPPAISMLCYGRFQGAVLAITSISDTLLAVSAANVVHILSLEDGELRTHGNLQATGLIYSLDFKDGNVALCDSRAGFQLWKYEPSERIPFKFIASDSSPTVTTRAVFYDGENCLASDKYGSLYSVDHSDMSCTKSLKMSAHCYLGETVSRILPTESQLFGNSFLVTTLSGSIYATTQLSGKLSPDTTAFLKRLQKRIASHLPTYRPTMLSVDSFINVDMLLHFANQQYSLQQKMVEDNEFQASVEYVLEMLDNLSRFCWC
uniref:DNA damage-binding protein 1 n=1 Tax=Spongospora subterranea TaxID=70186 RepID=A0A0H5R922_9EUKA|eukprot:CRZ10623.1 hypothetical protein [Spongospora subterranea]